MTEQKTKGILRAEALRMTLRKASGWREMLSSVDEVNQRFTSYYKLTIDNWQFKKDYPYQI